MAKKKTKDEMPPGYCGRFGMIKVSARRWVVVEFWNSGSPHNATTITRQTTEEKAQKIINQLAALDWNDDPAMYEILAQLKASTGFYNSEENHAFTVPVNEEIMQLQEALQCKRRSKK